MNMENKIKKIIDQNRDNIAFVIGNGINRYFGEGTLLSWNDLLNVIWNKYASFVSGSFTKFPDGITNTEFIDALVIKLLEKKNYSGFHQIKKDIANILVNWEEIEGVSAIVRKIEELNAPILTPNYDRMFEYAFEVSERRIPLSSRKRSTDSYPWNYYYGRKNKKLLGNPNDGFGIWHIHGMVSHPRSIRIGLNDYMGLVERSRSVIQNNFLNNQMVQSYGGFKPTNTWLDIVFKKSLFIMGLGLETEEVYLRWLLLQRAKYNVLYDAKLQGWYISCLKHGKISEGKKRFLETIGFEVIEIDNDDIIYKSIWK